MYTLVIKAPYRQGKYGVFLVVALLLFVFATLDVALLLRHVLVAFIWYQGPGGALSEFSDISYWVNAMKMVTFVAQTSIADGMLVRSIYFSLYLATEVITNGCQWRSTDVILCTTAAGLSLLHSVFCGLQESVKKLASSPPAFTGR